MLMKILKAWNQYKYRFVPWIAANINENSPRVIIPQLSKKDIVSDTDIERTLISLFRNYVAGDKIRPYTTCDQDFLFNMQATEDLLGFTVEKEPSQLPDGGTGVFVSTGKVKKGDLVAMYPGTVYQSWEPVLFISLANRFLFRCADGIHIDGCNDRLSKSVYLSCSKRDRYEEYICDVTWFEDRPLNPLAIGQFVNNQTKECPANVAYQEFDVPADFPLELMKFIPNIEARTMKDPSLEYASSDRLLRTVVLIALRDIDAGEELLSSYYTLIQDEESDEELETEENKKKEQKQITRE